MKEVEKFIQERTRKYCNEFSETKSDGLGGYISRKGFAPWLTIDDTRKVAEIAREETIKEVCEWLNSHYRDYMHNPTGKQLEAFFGMDMVEDLKMHLEDKP